jgi:hypothetical protein
MMPEETRQNQLLYNDLFSYLVAGAQESPTPGWLTEGASARCRSRSVTTTTTSATP